MAFNALTKNANAISKDNEVGTIVDATTNCK
jgi:hypothetical protein